MKVSIDRRQSNESLQKAQAILIEFTQRASSSISILAAAKLKP